MRTGLSRQKMVQNIKLFMITTAIKFDTR